MEIIHGESLPSQLFVSLDEMNEIGMITRAIIGNIKCFIVIKTRKQWLIWTDSGCWTPKNKWILSYAWLTYIFHWERGSIHSIRRCFSRKIWYLKYQEENDAIMCIMLAFMSNELQKQYEYMDSSTFKTNLKDLFLEANKIKQYEMSNSFFKCKTIEGSLIYNYGLKMNGYIKKLGPLSFIVDCELSINLVLQFLLDS